MEKTMYQVTVRLEDDFIIISGPDNGEGEQKVIITLEQAPLLIKWIQEVVSFSEED